MILLVLLVGSPVAVQPAAEAVEQCHGRTATLIGDGEARVIGTPGPDVIVSNGSPVKAGGGDDTICMTGVREGGSSYVLGEGGDDTIVVESRRYRAVRIFPGSGDDTVVGGPGRDEVFLGEDGDTADLGDGNDRVTLSERSRATGVDAGRGRDRLVVSPSGFGSVTSDQTRVLLDIPSGRVERDGVALAVGVTGFEAYSVSVDREPVLEPTTIIGGPGAEEIDVSLLLDADVRAGAGNDVVRLRCGIALGGHGNDHLTRTSETCPDSQLSGGPGADVLVGGPGPDRLFGGLGRDRADGRTGRDRCRAERKLRCEL